MESLMADQLASTVPATRIDTRDLRFVVKALHEFGEHWERIGEDLNVSNLKKITLDYDGVVSLCLIVMVDCLLRGRLIKNPGRPATWREIVRVVYHTNPAHAHLLAGKLNEFQKFSPGQLAQTVDDSPLVDEFPSDADIKKVVSQLHSLLVPAVAGRWFEIGALLGLPLNSLTIIRSDSTLPDPRDKLRKVLYEWLTFAEEWELETPSWQVLVDVVAHGVGGDEPGLAWEIADKHGKSGSGSSRGSVPDSTPHSYPPTASATQPGATAPFSPGASAKSKRPELNPGSHIIVKSEHVNYLAELLYPIAQNWELFVRELGVADRDVNRIRADNSSLQTEHGSSFGDFAKKCLVDGLYDWMLMDPQPTFGKVMRDLQSGLFSNATLAAKVEAYGERLLKEQPQYSSEVKSKPHKKKICKQPTPAEESNDSGDDSRLVDDSGSVPPGADS